MLGPRLKIFGRMSSTVSIGHLHHLLTVPVEIGRKPARFVLDTGIGLNVLSEGAASSVGCRRSGKVYVGRRMSGQEVSVPLGIVDRLAFGSEEQLDVEVGILDLGKSSGLAEIDGFLSLGFFRGLPFTIDYPAGLITIEDPISLEMRSKSGSSVEVQVHDDKVAIEVFLPLEIPGAGLIWAEVDTGSDSLILDQRFAARIGVDLGAQGVRSVTGHDETGRAFVRYLATLPGTIRIPGTAAVTQAHPSAIFQMIIHEGLVGDSFMKRFVVTYDLPRQRMIFRI